MILKSDLPKSILKDLFTNIKDKEAFKKFINADEAGESIMKDLL
jgi:hypothetical protein